MSKPAPRILGRGLRQKFAGGRNMERGAGGDIAGTGEETEIGEGEHDGDREKTCGGEWIGM